MEVTIKFNISNDAILDKDFIFCCDLLNLKEYEEFDRRVKKEYFTLYNSYLIIDIIKSNIVESFKHILKYIKIKNMEEILLYCCGTTNNNITDYILKYNADLSDYKKYIDVNVRSGSIYLLKKFNIELDNNWLVLLSIKGKLSDIKWLSKKIELSSEMFKTAIINNNTEVVDWLQNEDCKLLDYDVDIIYETGNIISREWIKKNNYKYNNTFSKAILVITDLEKIKFIYDNHNFELTEYCFDHACLRGNIKIIQWLHKLNCPFSENSVIGVTMNSNKQENFDWLVKNNYISKKNIKFQKYFKKI